MERERTMNEIEQTRDMKEAVVERKGELLDSLEIAMGTPSKGSAIKLKCYFDATDMDKADIKVKGLLQIRTYLATQGFQ